MEDRNQIIKDKHNEILRQKYAEIDRYYNRRMAFIFTVCGILMGVIIYFGWIK